MKTLLLTLCALCCLTGAASAVSYDLSVIVTSSPTGYSYAYSLTEYGPREGRLELALPVNILPEQPIT